MYVCNICEDLTWLFLKILAARQTVRFEIETLLTRPEQEPILMDMIHAVSKS